MLAKSIKPIQEDIMLETYFIAPKTLARLRAGPSGSYIDGFAATLKQDSYSRPSAIRYLRAAAHLVSRPINYET